MIRFKEIISKAIAGGIAAYIVMFGVKFTAYAGQIFIG
jgi:hypothetical protein